MRLHRLYRLLFVIYAAIRKLILLNASSRWTTPQSGTTLVAGLLNRTHRWFTIIGVALTHPTTRLFLQPGMRGKLPTSPPLEINRRVLFTPPRPFRADQVPTYYLAGAISDYANLEPECRGLALS